MHIIPQIPGGIRAENSATGSIRGFDPRERESRSKIRRVATLFIQRIQPPPNFKRENGRLAAIMLARVAVDRVVAGFAGGQRV